MRHVPIVGKFFTIIVFFALFGIGSSFFATSKMRVIGDNYTALNDHQNAASIDVSRAGRAMWAMRASIADLVMARSEKEDRAAEESFAAQHADFVSLMDKGAAAWSERASMFTDMKEKALNAVDKICENAVRIGRSDDDKSLAQAQASFVNDCAPAITSINTEIRTTIDGLLKENQSINNDLADITNYTIRTTWAMILGGLVLVMIGGFFAVKSWISKPLTTLATALSGIAAGDYGIAIRGADRKDEIGTIARVSEVFKTTGTEKIAFEAQTAQQQQEAEDKRAREEQIQKRLAEQQAQVVDSLARGLEHLSDGDLVFRLQDQFAADYEKLRSDFNAAMGKLQETMGEIAGNTSAIRAGTVEISTAADDLSRRTEQQAASLEETAAALDEITATVRKTSEGATHARSVVSTAKSDAEHSSEVVGRAVEAMTAIEASSKRIGQIISVIDEIAFQTNLLALNAGVEAARAGEAGRGFAVVASEVRALAQRSAEAAKEIKTLISASSQQVGEGVELVGETGKALQRIMTQVTEINIVVSDIAASAQEQSTGLDQVNTAINQMDQVTQQNAAMVEESTAATKNLAQETEALSGLVGRFNVDGMGQGSASRRRAGRAAAPAAPSRAKGGSARMAGAAQKMVVNGSPAGSGGADDWQDF